MDKIERVRATLAGKPADRPPFTVWYHFGTQHAAAERAAAAHLEFFEAYDLDLLKVMNDYDYPMPEGIDTITTPGDLETLRSFEPRDIRRPVADQLDRRASRCRASVEEVQRRMASKEQGLHETLGAMVTRKTSLDKLPTGCVTFNL